MAVINKTKTTNKVLFDVIRDLKKASKESGVGVFKAVAAKLAGSASQRSEVNLRKIEKFAKDGEKIIVPGKVLGEGMISKKVTVVAVKASESAKEKIEKAGGKFVEIRDYLAGKVDPKIRILG